jgi:lon-related putative ATP-dependent protease
MTDTMQSRDRSVATEAAKPLAPAVLRRVTDPQSLPADIAFEPLPIGLVGQPRATEAIRFGSAIRKSGFNLYAMGLPGTGRHTSILAYLTERAKKEPAPDDWVYVNNFKAPDKPKALRLPPGWAVRFRDAMDELIADLGVALPALFESDDYKARRSAIDQDFEEAQEKAFSAINEKARAKSIAIMRTPVGFAFAPMQQGQVIKPEDFEALPERERERIQADIRALQEELRDIITRMPALEKARRDRIRELNKELASGAVEMEIRDVRTAFAAIPAVQSFLDDVTQDLVANVEVFLETAEAAANAPLPVASSMMPANPRLRRYKVNVMVGGHADGDGAPVVIEPNPMYQQLIGRIEHISQMGALITDFTLIRPGALHRANGGYLVLDAREVLSQPFAWSALKRALKSKTISITSLAEQFSLISTISLEPDPIPLDVKIVLIGDRWLYYLLMALDPDFAELFKVEVDFDDDFDRTDDNVTLYARLISDLAEREKLKPLDRDALAGMIDETARLAEDAEKLSLQVGTVADILREADHWAAEAGRERIGGRDIKRAVDERRRRSARLRDRTQEAIKRNIVLIDTAGAAVGQVNGLSVVQLAGYSFGRPTRITARTRLGSGRLIDIEREVELGGPLHSKGVLILSGFLSARYALDVPISLQASLVFEQSYGGIDGDSASSAELYALLSALSEVPIRQSFAVTGSVNQFGQVQAIGGVNDKIEGFFDVCAARGLTGEQGVLIPMANVKHLMLREDVVEACAAGRFSVIPIATIDQGIEILTGRPAGARDAEGRFPPESVNGLVEAKLREYAHMRRRFGVERTAEKTNDNASSS